MVRSKNVLSTLMMSFIAMGVIAFLLVSAIFGWASLGITILIHEGSTIAVALNALRLLRYPAS